MTDIQKLIASSIETRGAATIDQIEADVAGDDLTRQELIASLLLLIHAGDVTWDENRVFRLWRPSA